MDQVLAAFPGARRALFRKYHIGGCSSCGFAPNETLSELCTRNGGLKVDEVITHIADAGEVDRQLEMTPQEVVERRHRGEKVRLLDLRTREEWDAVRLEGAEFVSQDLIQRLMGAEGADGWLVFYDHAGASSLDAAAYFAGHGFQNARQLHREALAAERREFIALHRTHRISKELLHKLERELDLEETQLG